MGDFTVFHAYAMEFFKRLKCKEFLHLVFNMDVWLLMDGRKSYLICENVAPQKGN